MELVLCTISGSSRGVKGASSKACMKGVIPHLDESTHLHVFTLPEVLQLILFPYLVTVLTKQKEKKEINS